MLKDNVMMQTIKQLILTCLILLFCYTAISKLMDVEEFRRQLANQELPGWSKDALVWLIPLSEITVSILLLFRTTRMIGLYGSALLMLLFTGYIGLVVFDFFDRTPCSCGGVLRSMTFEWHLVFNLFFLALSLLGIYMFHSQNKFAVTQKT